MTAQNIEAKDAVTSSVIPVNAVTARKWLERNLRNRKIAPPVVERYRRDMESGRWTFAGDPIRFDINGHLIDGQHRLAALAELDEVTIPLLVIQGLPSESQMVMDQGRKRTPGQQLGLLGIRNSNQVAAGVKHFLLWREGLMFRDSRRSQAVMTSAQIEDFVDKNANCIDRLQGYSKALNTAEAPPSATWSTAIAFDLLHPDLAQEFFVTLAGGGAPRNHPINTLDQRLRRIRRNKTSTSTREYMALIVMAWNAWRDGREIMKFQKPRGGIWTAESFPEPH